MAWLRHSICSPPILARYTAINPWGRRRPLLLSQKLLCCVCLVWTCIRSNLPKSDPSGCANCTTALTYSFNQSSFHRERWRWRHVLRACCVRLWRLLSCCSCCRYSFATHPAILKGEAVMVLLQRPVGTTPPSTPRNGLTGWSSRHQQASLVGSLRAAHSGAAYRGR